MKRKFNPKLRQLVLEALIKNTLLSETQGHENLSEFLAFPEKIKNEKISIPFVFLHLRCCACSNFGVNIV